MSNLQSSYAQTQPSLEDQLNQARQTIEPAKIVVDSNDSPLKQFKSGVSNQDIKCKENLELVVKARDGSPACVKPQTKIKLIERGWADFKVQSTYNPKIDPSDFVSEVNNKFFTLIPGTKFTYESKNEDGTERNEVYVTNQTKVIAGIKTIQVWDKVWVDGELSEETFDWYAQDKTGNVWYFGEDSTEYESGKVISKSGSWETGVDGAKPGIIMFALPEIGQPYRQEYYKGTAEDMGQVVGINETVNVPFGVFDRCIKIKDWDSLTQGKIEFKFYCPQVGGVALETDQKGASRTELIDFKLNEPELGGNFVTLKEGDREGSLLVEKIFQDSVAGLNFLDYPVARDTGFPITLHLGETASNGCTVELTLVKIEGNAATFLKKEHHDRPCPICLSEATTIDTPKGTINVKSLEEGMTIFTQDKSGHKIIGTILKTGKTMVLPNHKMVHIILEDSRELFASPNHPTADGRLVGELSKGDTLDGSKIKNSELVPYQGTYTYDILPSGQTGFYWANGILIKSTLS
ncbi:MAG TPA: hypothetical protein VLD38_00170 [Nitrosopumilaceae archaeon]|nr:hypothetical protein [Nitrosopumilaceae archaeon]